MRNKKDFFKPIDKEEKQLEKDLIDNNYIEIQSKNYKSKYSKIANNFMNKRKKLISIRTDEFVLDKIKKIALDNGLNYQTMINIMLFQIANKKIELKLS